MKIAILAVAAIIGSTASLSGAAAKVHGTPHHIVRTGRGVPPADLSTASLRPGQTGAARLDYGQGIDGQGILAPNGYRGEGSLTGGPAGGIDDGGP